MALEVKKKERESPQNLIRRFTKGIQQSGILIRARKGRYTVRLKSRNMRKKMAMRKSVIRKEYELMRKMGKLERPSFQR